MLPRGVKQRGPCFFISCWATHSTSFVPMTGVPSLVAPRPRYWPPCMCFELSLPNLPVRSTCFQAIVAGQRCEWKVHASPDGSLQDLNTGREYPYLFWEADSSDGQVSHSFGLRETRSFCVAGDVAGTIPLSMGMAVVPLFPR